ncbi:MAG: hypothetical protein AVDCRST_MAG55-432, partial [uncultured Rubrobacteraceae bacterium]
AGSFPVPERHRDGPLRRRCRNPRRRHPRARPSARRREANKADEPGI